MTAAGAVAAAVAPRRPWREALVLAAWLLLTIGLRPLLLPDEGRYAGVAFEMLYGSAIVPTLAGLPFFHKPPLLYWLDIAAMALFGANVFAARVGPALLAWALAWALFLHLRHTAGPAVARAGLAVLATGPFFFVGAQYVNHDIGVAAGITVAVLAWVQAVDGAPATARRWQMLGWAACALGVLAKGLIGVVLPLAVVLPWLLAQRRWRAAAALAHPAGLAVFAAVVLPWLLAMQSRYPGFFDYFIVEQHFRRYTGATFNNRQPFWFFIVVLPLLMLPWTLWLWPALRQRGARPALYLWWIAVVVGFFSLPQSKLVGYVMPALAPLAALLAPVVERRLRWPRLAAAAALLCAGIVAVLAWKTPLSHRDVALALRDRVRPGDSVVFVDRYFYDLPFYAGLQRPVAVLGDWADPDLPNHDNWRKELHDAARFSADAGASVLWPWWRLDSLPCAAGGVWLVATRDQLPRLLAVAGVRPVFEGRAALLLQACATGPGP